MSDIVTERSGSILQIQFNRPAKKNAMTSAMYVTMADVLNNAAKDDSVRVVLWHGAGDSFCAGNDLEDFLKNPMGPGDSPQSRLINALKNGHRMAGGLARNLLEAERGAVEKLQRTRDPLQKLSCAPLRRLVIRPQDVADFGHR